MARQTFRANLLAGEFPLSSGFYGRSIVVPQQDQHYIRPNVYSGEVADKNIGIPQIIFAENVMPFSAGFQSVNYTLSVAATVNQDFDQALYLRDQNDTKTLFSPANGKCYIFNPTTKAWTALNKTVPNGSTCSVANLKGRTFVHFSGNTNFYEWVAGALSNVTLTGLTPANVNGLTSANSYLVAWDFNTIYWSSTIDPTDFTPSLATGAGSQRVLALKGQIVYCKPINDGFVIYTTAGAVYARYSGNIRFPWVYSEVISASGIEFPEHACDEMDGNLIYVWTTDGMQQYDRLKASPIFPHLSEHAGLGYIEKYNAATKTIDKNAYNGKLSVKVSFIASRWFVYSYGVPGSTIKTHALIYDSSLKRWGKLAIQHVDAFEFFGDATVISGTGALAWNQLGGSWGQQDNAWFAYGTVTAGQQNETVPYKSIAFLGIDGTVSVLDFSHTTTTDNSILYLGKFQFVRERLFQVLDVSAEGMDQVNTNNKLAVLTSYDGRTFNKTTYPKLIKNTDELCLWQMRLTGINHTLRFEGNFQLNTVLLRGQIMGNR